jgi:hypothetical protein
MIKKGKIPVIMEEKSKMTFEDDAKALKVPNDLFVQAYGNVISTVQNGGNIRRAITGYRAAAAGALKSILGFQGNQDYVQDIIESVTGHLEDFRDDVLKAGKNPAKRNELIARFSAKDHPSLRELVLGNKMGSLDCGTRAGRKETQYEVNREAVEKILAEEY